MIEKLMKAQMEIKVTKDQSKQGIQFMYRTAEAILEVAKPVCVSHGLLLTVTDEIVEKCGGAYIKATASVTDGDKTISCSGLAKEPIKLMSMSAPQITGSCSSYARKTALGGLFAIDNNEDPDSERESDKTQRGNAEIKDIKKLINNALNHPNVPVKDKDSYIAQLKAKELEPNQEFLDKLQVLYNL